MMKARPFIEKALRLATLEPTLYVMGAFGAPSSPSSRSRYTRPTAHEYNLRPAVKQAILNSEDGTWFFDCVGLIKGILWGFDFDKTAVYGGAVYISNNVPDISADTMINKCSDISTDFSNIIPGEMLWCSGHAGIYVGDGMAVECTPAFSGGVQVTSVQNLGNTVYPYRTWKKHGRLPWIDYTTEELEPPFADVPNNMWYTEACRWAKESGLVVGTGNNKLGTGKAVTIERLLTILYNFYKLFILKGR